MEEIDLWMDFMKYIYFEENYYILPRRKILVCNQIEEYDCVCNSNGYWGTEKDGIMCYTINFKIYKFNDSHYKKVDESIRQAFLFDRKNWARKYRKEKIKRLNDRV